ncbi:imidazolonepropionase [Platysternon megacephalum]|uniref:Imidazolonepropionase n=1 Tax=Platysternon megacephalum TaxID=55544 RepID=A0A4D9DE17_9SAUR|nr:imidazolonepropionase [Platysternon megacephalum]
MCLYLKGRCQASIAPGAEFARQDSIRLNSNRNVPITGFPDGRRKPVCKGGTCPTGSGGALLMQGKEKVERLRSDSNAERSRSAPGSIRPAGRGMRDAGRARVRTSQSAAGT